MEYNTLLAQSIITTTKIIERHKSGIKWKHTCGDNGVFLHQSPKAFSTPTCNKTLCVKVKHLKSDAKSSNQTEKETTIK